MHLDIEQLNLLKPEHRERYMELERLFSSKGWKIVKTMAEQNAQLAHNAAANAANWADNRMAVGNRSAWQTIVNIEEQTEATYEKLAADASAAAEIVRIAEEHEYE